MNKREKNQSGKTVEKEKLTRRQTCKVCKTKKKVEKKGAKPDISRNGEPFMK